MQVKRREIYLADLDPVTGSEQGGTIPVIVLQNDISNKYAPTVIVAYLSGQVRSAALPTRISLNESVGKLKPTSVIITDQPRTLDKCHLLKCIGAISDQTLHNLNTAIKITFGLD